MWHKTVGAEDERECFHVCATEASVPRKKKHEYTTMVYDMKKWLFFTAQLFSPGICTECNPLRGADFFFQKLTERSGYPDIRIVTDHHGADVSR